MSGVYQIPGLILTVLCHTMVAYYINEQRYSKKIFVMISCFHAVLFIGLMGCGFAAGGWNAFFSYIGIIVLVFLFFCIVSRDGFFKKSFLFISYFGLFTVSDNLMKLIVKLCLPQISEMAGYYMAIVLRNMILLLALILYKKYAAATLSSLMDSPRKWWNLLLVALLFYVSQVVVTVLTAADIIPDMHLFLIFVSISLLMCAVYSVIFSNVNYIKKDAEAALIRQNAQYLAGRLSSLQNAVEANQRLRHDIRHHTEVIAEYAKAGDTSAILSYIGEYRQTISQAEVRQFSLNRTIDNILSVYMGKAGEDGIPFSVSCSVPGELKMSEIDLIALLGNLLENALYGCRNSGKEKPCMEIRIRLQGSRLVIVCNNTCSDKLKLSGNLPEGKSIGISSILSVCRKYAGNLDYKIENGVCSACAILNL